MNQSIKLPIVVREATARCFPIGDTFSVAARKDASMNTPQTGSLIKTCRSESTETIPDKLHKEMEMFLSTRSPRPESESGNELTEVRQPLR